MAFEDASVGDYGFYTSNVFIACGQKHTIQSEAFAIRQDLMQHLRGIALPPL